MESLTGSLTPELAGLCLLIALVAFLYASVGHGGASGYLAVLSFFAVSHEQMATTALILNILVAGMAFMAYQRAGHFRASLIGPLILTSMPAAYGGGLLKLAPKTYGLLLAATLVFAAWRLSPWFRAQEAESIDETEAQKDNPPSLPVAWIAGAGIGLLSGMVGVGGGIFLSPLMLLLRWADVKTTAATSALFIVVNAAAGLLGRATRDAIAIGPIGPLVVAGFGGGLLGSYYGANRFSNRTLRGLLALVLLIAAGKLILQWLG